LCLFPKLPFLGNKVSLKSLLKLLNALAADNYLTEFALNFLLHSYTKFRTASFKLSVVVYEIEGKLGYVDNWSLVRDFAPLARRLPVAVFGSGAR